MYENVPFFPNPTYADISRYPPNRPFHPVHDGYYAAAGNAIDRCDDPSSRALEKRRENREIIKDFVRENENPCRADGTKLPADEPKIWETRDSLRRAASLIEFLERCVNALRNGDNLSDEERNRKYEECARTRQDLIRLFEKFGSAENLERLEKRLKKRRKKRLGDSSRRAGWRVEKTLRMERRARRHEEIDARIREKREAIEREKQVERLRKDADIVLSDVRGKRNDARKFLAVLQELRNLRRVKVNVGRARGENLPIAADQAFDNIIGQLTEQWTCLDREYSIEERGLKLMLKADNEEKIEKEKRSTYDDWERALFGKKLRTLDSGRKNLHWLLTIRHAWDKYANFQGVGSRVPLHWITPVPPSSAAWQKCLKNG